MRSDLVKAAQRAARAMVVSVGAAAVVLRMPAPPVAGDTGEELGLRAPEFQRLTLGPVAIRRTTSTVEVLVPADALEELLGLESSGTVETAMRAVATVELGDEAYMLTATEAVLTLGRASLYRLVLQLPPTEVV